jgi:HSP20 family protein
MELMRVDPFKDLPSLRRNLGRWFDWEFAPATNGGWAPSVDVFEDDKAITIKVDLPEVQKKDIKVEIEDGMLTISGERKLEKEEKKDNYRRIERSYGTFYRSFSVPDDVDPKQIKAETADGVLRVTLPKTKAPKSEPQKIAVS